MKTIRFAVISDLHYRQHRPGEVCLPAASTGGIHADPMQGLFKFLNENRNNLQDSSGAMADYLLCPGDIADKAEPSAFDEGWHNLKKLKDNLGAVHLITATGNHEVDSRASEEHDKMGSVEVSLDPLQTLQKHLDYPSTALQADNRRWIYWGRGYEIIEENDVLFLLINSSHYHWTTRTNEFERGRIGDVALSCLREDLKEHVGRGSARLFVALLHHHPVPHQDLDVELGKIEMDNGAKLMELFAETEVAWLIVHGHKHHPRLVRGQSSSSAVVFAAGSFGAHLNGTLAAKTRPQFYLINASIVDQQSQPEARGTVRAFSWNGSEWEPAIQRNQGLPDRCGYKVPQVDLSVLSLEVQKVLEASSSRFLEWSEIVALAPNLAHLLPEEIRRLPKAFQVANVKAAWPEELWFPKDVAR